MMVTSSEAAAFWTDASSITLLVPGAVLHVIQRGTIVRSFLPATKNAPDISIGS
jgi:hypothetical protein